MRGGGARRIGRLPRVSRRDDILTASAQAIADVGVRGLRVSDVAARVGVATSLIYYHFTDRDTLVTAALDHVTRQALAFRRRPGAEPARTVERLLEQFTAEFVDDPEVVDHSRAWNELRASAVHEPALREAMAAASRAWTDDIAAAVREAQAAGNVAAGVDADGVALQVAVFMEGLDSRWLTGELTTAEAVHALRDVASRLLQTPGS